MTDLNGFNRILADRLYYEEPENGITIYCGDCRDILPHLESVDLVLADPPYGISYCHGAERISNASRFNGVRIHGDDKPFDPTPFMDQRKVILWGANNYADKLPASRGWLVWDKRVQSSVNDQSDCELAWTNILTTARIFYHVWDGFRKGTEHGTTRVHPTQKPVALMLWCIGKAGSVQSILDPYMGSGTTLVAAKQLHRRAIGIEIEEKYCAIAKQRLRQEVLPL
jgi:site-specific DNA-methyltransferase (adenine-specific)/modification methylase